MRVGQSSLEAVCCVSIVMAVYLSMVAAASVMEKDAEDDALNLLGQQQCTSLADTVSRLQRAGKKASIQVPVVKGFSVRDGVVSVSSEGAGEDLCYLGVVFENDGAWEQGDVADVEVEDDRYRIRQG